MTTTDERTTDETLEQVRAERNDLWEEVQELRAQDRELEHWRERALAAESTLAWRLTELLRRARRDPVGFARAVVRCLRALRSS